MNVILYTGNEIKIFPLEKKCMYYKSIQKGDNQNKRYVQEINNKNIHTVLVSQMRRRGPSFPQVVHLKALKA